ncbi:MAG: TonB-dependent receptor, partial [Parafilimonas sp.]
TNYNPLAQSEGYDDHARTTTILATVSPYFKITKDLEYRILGSLNYSSGIRRAQEANFLTIPGIQGVGWAGYLNNELLTQQITHTLNFNKAVSSSVNLSATLGYEYTKFQNKGFLITAYGFSSNAIPYTDYFQGSNTANRSPTSFDDPSSELQSYFGRVNVNLRDKYLLTATFRADGSNKFGANNKYGYFPSFGAAWVISNEDFMKGSSVFNSLKLRVGWGQTGNQEFPAGAAQEQFKYDGPNSIKQINVANPDLKWETSTTTNAGIDFALWNNRFSGSVDYFYKNTTDLLFNFDAIAPAPAAKYWINLNGNVINSGAEVSLYGLIISKRDFQFSLGAVASFLHNELKNYVGPDILTGAIRGQGLSGAFSQKLANGQPLNSFWLGEFVGINKAGIDTFAGGDPNSVANRHFVGDPNPSALVGLSANLSYKKLSLIINMNGAFGFEIYNNTTQATLAIGNLGANRNIATSVYNPNAAVLESTSNSQPVSTRYLEKGDYMKMGNMTLSYNIGAFGKVVKTAFVYVTAQNLFVLTNYTGFDPEVNTPEPLNGVPSFGIEYTPYPSARTFILGVNFSL